MLVVLLVLQQIGAVVGGLLGLKRGMRTKFAHTFSEMSYYITSVLCLSRLCWNASWFWPSGWREVMFDGRVQQVDGLQPYTAPADLKLFYIVETSYYLSSFALLLVRPKKKDFMEMAFHHVVTAFLLLLSSLFPSPWASWGYVWSLLWAFWGCLGPSWAVLWPTCGPRGSYWAPIGSLRGL